MVAAATGKMRWKGVISMLAFGSCAGGSAMESSDEVDALVSDVALVNAERPKVSRLARDIFLSGNWRSLCDDVGLGMNLVRWDEIKYSCVRTAAI